MCHRYITIHPCICFCYQEGDIISLQILHFVRDGTTHKIEPHTIRIRRVSAREHIFEVDQPHYKKCLSEGRWWLVDSKDHPHTNMERQEAVARANTVAMTKNKLFDILGYNCEHLVTEILTGKARCSQFVPLRAIATTSRGCANAKFSG